MKQYYDEPEWEFIVLKASDVITTSNPDGPIISNSEDPSQQ